MNALEIQTLVCGAYGWFQQALIRLCVCAAVALVAVLILRTQTVRDAAARIAALWHDAAHFTRLAVLALLSVCVIAAGTKTNSLQLLQMPFTKLATGGTPVVPVVPPSSTGGTPVVPVVVTPEEIAQGWRLENVVTNDAVSYSMPTNGVIPFSLLFRFFLRWMRGFGILTALAHSDVMLLRVPSSRVTCLANGAKDGFCNYP